MRNFKRLFLVVFLLLLMAVVMVFVLENQLAAQLQFLGWTLPQLPVSVYLLLALCVGLVVGPLLTVFSRRGPLK
ncbi:DUF1049 domain-containing protein [Pseudomonas tructae]|uniref:DUF1049 domain-containing protein n=1 Tax=Pseudomonas tructae TaxID=2518644 RepID=A0A411MMN5_9PSED|nr:lipopolysaccharide assembly protein LapA domain-containing protein [Pseudomonas tructae]QBF27930.1 DUF1049 domain-containing protein [Pseudomonas tructae]